MPTITHLYRYPIKGMTPEALTHITLTPGEPIPHDRLYAVAHGTTDFDANAPKHHPKTDFIMLMKNEQLAALRTHYDHDNQVLQIFQKEQLVASGNLQMAEGRYAIEQFFINYLGKDIRGNPKIVHAPNHTISDVNAKVLSCINLNSVRELEKVVGTAVDPLRFRANVYFDDAPAWIELQWANRQFRLGTATVEGFKPIERCAATNVNPQTAQRDLQIPQTLINTYGHRHLGIYVRVVQGGEVAVADELREI
jgi:hypothetical protein